MFESRGGFSPEASVGLALVGLLCCGVPMLTGAIFWWVRTKDKETAKAEALAKGTSTFSDARPDEEKSPLKA